MTSSMLTRVDFMDLKDPLGVLSDALAGFKPIHLGMRYGDFYLSVPRNEPSSWKPYNIAHRVVAPLIVHSFEFNPPEHDPKLVAMIGEGWIVDSGFRMFLTEWLHVGADIGAWRYRPKRTTCVGTVVNVLNAMHVPVLSTTSRGLYNEMMALQNAGLVKKTK